MSSDDILKQALIILHLRACISLQVPPVYITVVVASPIVYTDTLY